MLLERFLLVVPESLGPMYGIIRQNSCMLLLLLYGGRSTCAIRMIRYPIWAGFWNMISLIKTFPKLAPMSNRWYPRLTMRHFSLSSCPGLPCPFGVLHTFPTGLYASDFGYGSRCFGNFFASHESDFKVPSNCYTMVAYRVLGLTVERASHVLKCSRCNEAPSR
jgi:hypothetical protein